MTADNYVHWHDKLYHEAFYERADAVELPEDYHEAIDDALETVLTPEERTVVVAIFRDAMRLYEAGELIGKSHSCAYVYKEKALKKLRTYATTQIKYGMQAAKEERDKAKADWQSILDGDPPITVLNLTGKARKCLSRGGITTVIQLFRAAVHGRLRKISYCGKKTVADIEYALDEFFLPGQHLAYARFICYPQTYVSALTVKDIKETLIPMYLENEKREAGF